MKQEDKDLLIKDLCARLPYGVKAYVRNWSKLDRKYYEGTYTVASIHPSLNDILVTSDKFSVEVILGYDDYEIKPYLFPLSSMTEEQKNECFKGTPLEIDKYGDIAVKDNLYGGSQYTDLEIYLEVINWLLKNHFDIYGLISKDLAIDATNLNIY